MSQTLEQLVLSGRLEAAMDLARAMPFDDLGDAMQRLAFDSESINCYGLAVALAEADQSANYHYLAAELLAASPLNRLPGAYALSYFHGRRAAALAPDDWSFLEFLLFFHRHPDEVMTEEEARTVAEQLLARNPDNAAAKRVLGA